MKLYHVGELITGILELEETWSDTIPQECPISPVSASASSKGTCADNHGTHAPSDWPIMDNSNDEGPMSSFFQGYNLYSVLCIAGGKMQIRRSLT